MIDIPYDDTILTWVTTFKKKCNFEIQVTTIIKKQYINHTSNILHYC